MSMFGSVSGTHAKMVVLGLTLMGLVVLMEYKPLLRREEFVFDQLQHIKNRHGSAAVAIFYML